MKFTTLVISLSAIFAQASSSFTTNDATTDTAAVVSEHQLQTKLLLDNISTNVHPDPIKRALTPKYAKNKKSRSKTNVPVPPVVPVPPLVPDILTVRKFEGTYVYPGCGGGVYRANIDCDFDNDLCEYEEFRVGTFYDTDLVGEDILDDSFISVGDPDSSNYYIKPSTVEDPELICTLFGTFSASTAGKERTNELKPIALSVSDACSDVSKAKQYVVKVGSLFDRVYLSFSQDGGETYYTQDQPRSTTKVDTEGEERRKLGEGWWCSSWNPVNAFGCPGEPSADPWEKTEDSQCGGSNIIPLEDGTPYGWKPNSPGSKINKCKTRCEDDRSCNAFIWRKSDSSCRWKSGVSAETMFQHEDHDCYLHEEAPEPTPEPTPKLSLSLSLPSITPTITINPEPTSPPLPTWGGNYISSCSCECLCECRTEGGIYIEGVGKDLNTCMSQCGSSPCYLFDWWDMFYMCYPPDRVDSYQYTCRDQVEIFVWYECYACPHH